MSPETRIQLFLVGISAVALAWNIYVMAFVRSSNPLKTELASSRPFTRKGVSYLLWVVRIQTLALVYVTISSFIRNYYALPTIIESAPTWATLLVVGQYVFFFFPAILPAALLYYLVATLREHDRLVAVRMERYQSLPYERSRHSEGR